MHPCGHVEDGESFSLAAARELEEETGLHGTAGRRLHHVDKRHRTGKPYRGSWYLMESVSGVLQADDDAMAAAWFRADDLPSMAFEDDISVIRMAVNAGWL